MDADKQAGDADTGIVPEQAEQTGPETQTDGVDGKGAGNLEAPVEETVVDAAAQASIAPQQDATSDEAATEAAQVPDQSDAPPIAVPVETAADAGNAPPLSNTNADAEGDKDSVNELAPVASTDKETLVKAEGVESDYLGDTLTHDVGDTAAAPSVGSAAELPDIKDAQMQDLKAGDNEATDSNQPAAALEKTENEVDITTDQGAVESNGTASEPAAGPSVTTAAEDPPTSQQHLKHDPSRSSNTTDDQKQIITATGERADDSTDIAVRPQASPPKATSGDKPAPGGSGTSQGRSRVDEQERQRHETEDMRLMWLSLPSHDHPSYYSDTDDDALSDDNDATAALQPRNASGRVPYLVGPSIRRRPAMEGDEWIGLDERSDVLDEDDDDGIIDVSYAKKSNASNRGNKLRKGARWVRIGKLGMATEAKSEKDVQERFTARLRALQRTQVENMLESAGGPSVSKPKRDMLHGCDRILARDVHLPLPVEESSTLLAPQLLRPILSSRALLESHTLRHTFRNPHIGALSRTALDLRESEGQLSRSLSRCLGAMEKRAADTAAAAEPKAQMNGESNGTSGHHHSEQSNGQMDRSTSKIDAQAIGVEGTHGTEDELNPSFGQLDRLFVTKDGLPIPFGGANDEERVGEQDPAAQTVLSATQQRDVIRAALECLHELGADSLEYVERLDEVRSRLAAVKRKRLQVWNALRIWALKREGDDVDAIGVTVDEGGGRAGGKTSANTAGDAANGKPGSGSTSSGRKRQRV